MQFNIFNGKWNKRDEHCTHCESINSLDNAVRLLLQEFDGPSMLPMAENHMKTSLHKMEWNTFEKRVEFNFFLLKMLFSRESKTHSY